MGPRPADFDEELVRRAPTFIKWTKLPPGGKLSYACREFVKGGVDDEERLMRRIMIARRNNLKDHATLKEARAAEARKRGVIPPPDLGKARGGKKKPYYEGESPDEAECEDHHVPLDAMPSNPSGTKRRRIAGTLQPTDEEVLMEMDVPAVEATRSYRKWCSIPYGESFTYNQTYIKGKDDHDWLLKKNIWRRMRYRRENRIKVAQMKGELPPVSTADWPTLEIPIADPNLAPAPVTVGVDTDFAPKEEGGDLVSAVEDVAAAAAAQAVEDAAAAAAAQVGDFEPEIDADAVAALGENDPIVSLAVDAAAQLAAAAVAVADTESGIIQGDDAAEQVEVMIRV